MHYVLLGLVALGCVCFGVFVGPVARLAIVKVTDDVVAEKDKVIADAKAETAKAKADLDTAKVDGMKDIAAVKAEADKLVADAVAEKDKALATVETMMGIKSAATPAPVAAPAPSAGLPASAPVATT
jgi:F0F1-type ATP synthase membrane subunit b/b'